MAKLEESVFIETMKEIQKAVNGAVALVGPINVMYALAISIMELARKSQEAGKDQAVSTATYVVLSATLEGMAQGLRSHIMWSNIEEGVIAVHHDHNHDQTKPH